MKLTHALTTLLLALLMTALPGIALAATVKVTVNNTQITDVQINQRASLFRLERRGATNTARQQMAQDELIDEALKFQEAERLGIKISAREVDEGYLNVARGVKVSVSNLNQILAANGVSQETLKDRLRASLAWQKITAQAVMPLVQISELDLDQKAEEQVNDAMSFDYLIKEVLFVMPGGKGSASQRTAQANQYRKSFQGCDTAVDLSLSYTDAAVIDVGRRHATQLPEAIATELAGLNAGGISKPRVTERGVSMLAICAKEQAKDLTFLKNNLRQEVGTEKLQDEAAAYLQKLKDRAVISVK